MWLGMRAIRIGFALAGALILSACTPSAPELMHLRSTTNGPDEFAILPPKALELPADLTALPAPTPGASNLTDQHPMDDAIVALGGTPRTTAGGLPASDSALFAYASRFGISIDIRSLLAAEDLEFRRRNDGKLLERVFAVNVYFKAYAKQSLDQQAELERWRQAGVQTPSAPPALKGE